MDQDLKKRICNLLTEKSIVTNAATALFAFCVIKGTISGEQLLLVFQTIIGFYFGSVSERSKSDQLRY